MLSHYFCTVSPGDFLLDRPALDAGAAIGEEICFNSKLASATTADLSPSYRTCGSIKFVVNEAKIGHFGVILPSSSCTKR